MKKILFVILTAFAVLNSYGQGGQVYDICYDPGCTLPPTTCPPAPPPPPGCVPPTPTNCPIICRNVVIDNQLDCDLDFWWDYSTTAPCGDIVPAYWACPWQGYFYCPPFSPPTWPPSSSYNNHVIHPSTVKTLQAYELKWPNCTLGDDPTACYCPDFILKWRMDADLIANATTAPLGPTLLGSSFTFISTTGSVSKYYYPLGDCAGNAFYVYFDSALDKYTFKYF
jgi:hypothetical protein